MTDDSTLQVSQADGVLTIAFARPKANAFTTSMVDEIRAALKKGGADASVRCIVLTGAGRFFSAGQDLGEIGDRVGELSFREHLLRTYNRLILQMRTLEKPIIGAINGPAAGAGLGVALATDIKLAGQSARFIFGFTGIGLTADSAVSLMLPRLIGPARAAYVAFTNQPVTASQALEWGMVNEICPDDLLMQRAGEWAASLAEAPTRAIGLTKRAFNRTMFHDLESTLDYEAHLQDIAGRTEDHAEGVAAFLEKRAPVFTGR